VILNKIETNYQNNYLEVTCTQSYYLISIYQRKVFHLSIIKKNNCVQFSYCTISVALQLHDWMNSVLGRFIQSRNSKVKESLHNLSIMHY
jgi:hypothetical protein